MSQTKRLQKLYSQIPCLTFNIKGIMQRASRQVHLCVLGQDNKQDGSIPLID